MQKVSYCHLRCSSLARLRAVGPALVVLLWCVCSCSSPPRPGSVETPREVKSAVRHKRENRTDLIHGYHWQTIEMIAEIIGTAAAWTATGPATDDEWRSIVRVALALQKTSPKLVEQALAAHMILDKGRQGSTRPMLILRVMFDLPEDELSQAEWIALGAHSSVHLCGGIPPTPIPGGPLFRRSLAAPLTWTADGPRLTAIHMTSSYYSSGPGYQPQLEYRYFLEHFPFRQGLNEFVDRDISGPGALLDLIYDEPRQNPRHRDNEEKVERKRPDLP